MKTISLLKNIPAIIHPVRAHLLASVILAVAWCSPSWAAQNLALLVGVGNYAANKLDGPPNDVDAMATVLTQRWGFAPSNIKTLKDQAATRAGILAAIDDLVERARPDDRVLIYLSGHGTSDRDSDNAKNNIFLPEGTGAFVPMDAIVPVYGGSQIVQNKLIVGRLDLRPRLLKIDAKGAKVVFFVDACYSGELVRGIKLEGLPQRYLAQPGQNDPKPGDMLAAQNKPSKTEPYAYKHLVFLSASAKGETARDINKANLSKVRTYDGKPHGAFTDALIRVMTNQVGADADGNGRLSYLELKAATSTFMAERGYGHNPQLLPTIAEDSLNLSGQSVLETGQLASGEALKKPPVVTPRLRVAAPNITDPALLALIDRIPSIERVKERSAGDINLMHLSNQLVLRTVSDDTVTAVSIDDPNKIAHVLSALSTAHHLRGLAQQGQRAVLPCAVNPADFGGNFLIDKDNPQKVNFVVRPDRAATIVILNLDADGQWTTLYPKYASEQAPLPDKQAHFIPGNRPGQMIEVTGPEGMDSVFVFAFDEAPPALKDITGLAGVDFQDARMTRFVSGLPKQAGRYTFARLELRAFKKPVKPGKP